MLCIIAVQGEPREGEADPREWEFRPGKRSQESSCSETGFWTEEEKIRRTGVWSSDPSVWKWEDQGWTGRKAA